MGKHGARLHAKLNKQSAFIFKGDFVAGSRQNSMVKARFIDADGVNFLSISLWNQHLSSLLVVQGFYTLLCPIFSYRFFPHVTSFALHVQSLSFSCLFPVHLCLISPPGVRLSAFAPRLSLVFQLLFPHHWILFFVLCSLWGFFGFSFACHKPRITCILSFGIVAS